MAEKEITFYTDPDNVILDPNNASGRTANTLDLQASILAVGPSRKINPNNWPVDVKPPLLMLFTHNEAAISNRQGHDVRLPAYEELLPGINKMNWLNTTGDADFGYYAGDYDGGVHPMVGVYEALDNLRKERKYSQFIKNHGLMFDEAIFGASWITNLVYVLEDNEDQVPPHLAVKGFEAARLVNKSRRGEIWYLWRKGNE